MATYRKTATVDAVRFTGDNFDEVRAFLGDNAGAWFVRASCWIVREPNGECYSCDDDVFRSTYAPDSAEPQPFAISDDEMDAVSDALAVEEDDEADAELFAVSYGLSAALDLLSSCTAEYKVFEELALRLEKVLTVD